jgi:hypothetical protein
MFGPFLSHFAALRELRIACTVAQMEREGGISPRVSPLAQVCIIAQLIYLLVKVMSERRLHSYFVSHFIGYYSVLLLPFC